MFNTLQRNEKQNNVFYSDDDFSWQNTNALIIKQLFTIVLTRIITYYRVYSIDQLSYCVRGVLNAINSPTVPFVCADE